MAAADFKMIQRKIEDLSPKSLTELAEFLDYLHYKEQKQQKGSPWAKEVYDLFAPVRQAVEESGMTEDEINRLLDEELEAVRRERDE